MDLDLYIDHNGSFADADPALGVAITAFGSAKIIAGCLERLLVAQADIAKVVITDNSSKDA